MGASAQGRGPTLRVWTTQALCETHHSPSLGGQSKSSSRGFAKAGRGLPHGRGHRCRANWRHPGRHQETPSRVHVALGQVGAWASATASPRSHTHTTQSRAPTCREGPEQAKWTLRKPAGQVQVQEGGGWPPSPKCTGLSSTSRHIPKAGRGHQHLKTRPGGVLASPTLTTTQSAEGLAPTPRADTATGSKHPGLLLPHTHPTHPTNSDPQWPQRACSATAPGMGQPNAPAPGCKYPPTVQKQDL